MPLRREGTSHLIRILRGRAGRLAMRTELTIRFDYGSIIPWVTREGDHGLQAVAGPDKVVLRSDVPLRPDGFKHHADFMVSAGETVTFVLVYARSFDDLPSTTPRKPGSVGHVLPQRPKDIPPRFCARSSRSKRSAIARPAA